jgi:methionyl-tRNA formyltransferase
VLTDVAVQVDTLLAENWTPEELTPALAAWGAKGLDARKLPSVANEIANRAPDRGQSQFAPRPSTTDQRVAAVQALKARYVSNGANVLQLPRGES